MSKLMISQELIVSELTVSQELTVSELTSFYHSIVGGHTSHRDPWVSTILLWKDNQKEEV
jgi:hypothetical protein